MDALEYEAALEHAADEYDALLAKHNGLIEAIGYVLERPNTENGRQWFVCFPTAIALLRDMAGSRGEDHADMLQAFHDRLEKLLPPLTLLENEMRAVDSLDTFYPDRHDE